MRINFSDNLKELLGNFFQNKQSNDEKTITIISAVKLAEDDLTLIKKIFSIPANCKVVNQVDSNILGGLVFKFGSQVIDLSIKGQLQNFKKLLVF